MDKTLLSIASGFFSARALAARLCRRAAYRRHHGRSADRPTRITAHWV